MIFNTKIVILIASFIHQTSSQSLGPSLWDWGYTNITKYTVYPNIPHTNKIYIPHGDHEASSACNGGGPNDVGFACPHLLLFSSDLLLAAERDGLGGNFYYGTAASQTDGDCGKCFQVKIMDAELKWNDTLSQKQLILQITNSGNDVVKGQFDVHIGAGGFGYYTACNSDCRNRYCQGGPCSTGLFDSTFEDWNPSSNCYAGGVKEIFADYDKVWEACCKLTKNNNYKDEVLRQTCWYSNIMLYHQNFFSTDSIQVKCPEGLTKATGLKRIDDDGLPYPDTNNKHNIFCRNNNCITGYQDCCKMSCSWKKSGSADAVLSRVYTCDHNGLII